MRPLGELGRGTVILKNFLSKIFANLTYRSK